MGSVNGSKITDQEFRVHSCEWPPGVPGAKHDFSVSAALGATNEVNNRVNYFSYGILFNGKLVAEHLTLQDAGISQGSTLRMCFGLRGGVGKDMSWAKETLAAMLVVRGAKVSAAPERAEAMVAHADAAKINYILAMKDEKERWNELKKIATSGNIRLIEVHELKEFQASKKSVKASSSSSSSGAKPPQKDEKQGKVKKAAKKTSHRQKSF